MDAQGHATGDLATGSSLWPAGPCLDGEQVHGC